jgi:hypothetical protein
VVDNNLYKNLHTIESLAITNKINIMAIKAQSAKPVCHKSKHNTIFWFALLAQQEQGLGKNTYWFILLLANQRTNEATQTIIVQNVKSYLNNTKCEIISIMLPDATRALIAATKEQQAIGWEHWFKGRITQEWATLVNYDIATVSTGKKSTLLKNGLLT